MSLSSPYQEHYYVADGVTTTFAFGSDFTALSSSYVKCIIYFEDGTNCVPTFNVDLTTGYINIVTLTKPDGTVLTVPPAGSIVRVFRDVPEQQNVTASQLQNYTAKQLEKIFDSVVAMIQEVSYSDLHKTIRLTETQRDVAVEQLTEEKDQSILYWDFESHTLKATDYGQDEVVKSETVDRLVYLQPEGKIYFIPKGSNNPIAIGSATIHNDLGGRNAPDCHPESAITNLTTHLQELRDKDTEIDGKADYAVSTADDAKDLATTAKNTADAAYEKAEETERAVQGFDDRITQAEEDSAYAKEAVDEHITDKDNPHEVTKDQVGLGNCDNTSDEDKPISTATQSALDLKMPISTKYGAALSLTINSTTYVVTAQLKDQDGNNLGTAQTIDLPLESVVVSGSYDSATKEVVLTLQDGSTIRFSVADLVSGLQTEITALNMLNADLVDDTSTTHKFVTTTEKTTWNGKQDAISDLATIRSGASAGATAVQPADLANVATTGDYDDLINKPTIPTVNDATLTIQKNGTSVATFTANASSNVTANISVPTTTNDLTNNSGFITSSDIPVTDVTVGGTSVVSAGVAVVPAIPTVNNPTITITQGGVTKGSFTLNQATGDTIALDAGGGSADIDNLTITTNADDEIQAVATVNQNTATGATNPIYDWVGTFEEYQTQNIATLHPDWLCFIKNKTALNRYLVEAQYPTAENNYTWYFLYNDGWVEQGGYYYKGSSIAGNNTITLPIEMADTNYTVLSLIQFTAPGNAYVEVEVYPSRTTTSFVLGVPSADYGYNWEVKGMAA